MKYKAWNVAGMGKRNEGRDGRVPSAWGRSVLLAVNVHFLTGDGWPHCPHNGKSNAGYYLVVLKELWPRLQKGTAARGRLSPRIVSRHTLLSQLPAGKRDSYACTIHYPFYRLNSQPPGNAKNELQ